MTNIINYFNVCNFSDNLVVEEEINLLFDTVHFIVIEVLSSKTIFADQS